MSKTAYMIQSASTGLFSPGGQSALDLWKAGGWSKNGKVWSTIGALKNHLNQFVWTEWGKYDFATRSYPDRKDNVNHIPDDWQVVQLEIVQVVKGEKLVAKNMVKCLSHG